MRTLGMTNCFDIGQEDEHPFVGLMMRPGDAPLRIETLKRVVGVRWN